MKDREEKIRTVVGRDFNARIGRESGEMKGEKEEAEYKERQKSHSKNSKVNKEGRRLVEFIEERGQMVFNGKVREDEEENLHSQDDGNVR